MESGKIASPTLHASAIREAFFALLAEVGFAKMTVADISRADINRGTFYLHYDDVRTARRTYRGPRRPTRGNGVARQRRQTMTTAYSDDDAYTRVAQRVVERRWSRWC